MSEENFKFKEKWYVSNIFFGVLLLVCSIIPFAAILGIPFVVIKTHQSKKNFKMMYEDFTQKKLAFDTEMTKYREVLSEKTRTLDKIGSDLNIANKEVHRLKGLISPDAQKLEAIKVKVKELEDKSNELKKQIVQIEQDKKELEQSKKDKIREAKEEIQSTVKKEKEAASIELKNLKDKSIQLNEKIEEQKAIINKNKSEIIELRDEVLLQSFSLYRPQYDFVNSAQYKNKLDEIRNAQKQMIKQDTAALGATNWTVNNDARKGKKMVNDTKKLLLRAFNSECEFVISKVKYNNFDTCLKRIQKASETISKLGVIMNISIHPKYYKLKVQELRLALEYQQMKQREKEEQQELRARMREEARIQREIEEERKKAEKEKQHYINALKEAQKQLAECEDEAQKTALEEKLDKMQEQVSKIDKNLADIDYREANQRVGYVYVISNIGSFGENVYKIGMTRRLNPQERVDELGNASVPFNFDVHAMIFSKDAPALETALHHTFDDRKVNMVNKRREFFNVTLDDIEKVVKENFDGSVEFIKTAVAEQYRETLKIKQGINKQIN